MLRTRLFENDTTLESVPLLHYTLF